MGLTTAPENISWLTTTSDKQKRSEYLADSLVIAERRFLEAIIDSACRVEPSNIIDNISMDDSSLNAMIDIMRVFSPQDSVARRQDSYKMANLIIENNIPIEPLLSRVRSDNDQAALLEGIVSTHLVDLFLAFRAGTSPLCESTNSVAKDVARRARSYNMGIKNIFPELWIPRSIKDGTGFLPRIN